MSSYPNTLITNAGLDLIAEANAQGEALIFTKVKLGDGSLPEGQSIQTMTALISPKLESELTSGSVKNGQAKLRFSVENSGLDEGFFAREVGVFAKVGEEGTETLYAYTNGGNYVDYIPNKDVPIDAEIMDVYIVTGNAATVQIQVDSAAYATVLDLEEHNTGSDSHADLLHLRKPSTAYAVGDIAYSALLPSWAYIECTVGGTTDSGDLPMPSSVVVNATFTDGTVTWKIRKIGNGSGRNVGDIFLHAGNGENPQGALLCDGSAVSRTMYPDLFAKIGTTYGAGDGSTTFNLPNLSDNRFVEGSTTAGTAKSAGLPNITGEAVSESATSSNVMYESCFWNDSKTTGAFTATGTSNYTQKNLSGIGTAGYSPR